MTPRIETAIVEGVAAVDAVYRSDPEGLLDCVRHHMRKVAWAAVDEISALSITLELIEKRRSDQCDSLEKFQRELQDFATVLNFARMLRDSLVQERNESE